MSDREDVHGRNGASGLYGGFTLTPSEFAEGEGVPFSFPTRVTSHEWSANSLVLLCDTRRATNYVAQTHETRMFQFRDETGEAEQVELRIDIWSDDVFRLRFGSRRFIEAQPGFPPREGRMLVGDPDASTRASLRDSGDCLEISTKAMTIKVDKGPLSIRAYDDAGRLFWRQRKKEIFTSDIIPLSVAQARGHSACFESIELDDDEAVYGLGERFDYVERRGKEVDFWNKDAIGTSSQRSYINVPFVMTTGGYGLFLNSSAVSDWQVGTRENRTLRFAVVDEGLDYFVIHGPDPSSILKRYAELTGFAPMPPVWSFGLWMSRNSYMSWEVVRDVAARLRERDIPCDVLHLDSAWFNEDLNCDLRFSQKRFPDPEGNMRELREDGFRVSLWQYNFIPPKRNNANYEEAVRRGYVVKGGDGGPYAYPEGTQGAWIDDVIIDFSNPEACSWYRKQIEALIRLGASTIKTDFGEGIPADGVFANVEGDKFHNLYSLVYNSVVAQGIRDGGGDGVVWARSGTAGSQRYPIHWGGDSQCSFAGLAGTLRAALSVGLSGIPFFAHDIGGFIGRPDSELYVRWAQFGLFSSHSRCHGAGNENSREPWSFGPEAERIFRRYAKLRYSLLPYILDEARACTTSGLPMVRALVIEHPEDRNVWRIEDQYYFGGALMIAPVLRPLEEGRARTLYLPEGKWFDYWTKEAIVSRGEWIEREVDLETMPMYVRSGRSLDYAEGRPCTGNRPGRIVRRELYGVEGPIAEEGIETIRYA
jgi:Alpha-glucosidases, family 31 of glycosyl hydrolases